MIFSSFIFLCYFLPTVFFIYFAIPGTKIRNLFLLIASLIFYAWSDCVYLVYLLGVILLTYLASVFMKKKIAPRLSFFLGIFVILGGLFYFKYSCFTFSFIKQIAHADWSIPDIIMPIGISFYSFQAISYLIDVYRGGAFQKNILNLALYISMFPQLVAGPIVRYNTVATQLRKRSHTVDKLYTGFRRFLIGLGKKVIIADILGASVDRIFSTPVDSLSVPIVWTGMVFYALQIYFDFSGYSDMAIGLGRLFGFDFPENFNYPYISRSISEFWRRWHISLSSWFKEYIYIPLGGNRKGLKRTCFNLMLVFLLTGIWHGANWTFILWGIWYGVFIILEKCLRVYRPQSQLSSPVLCVLSHAYTLMVVLLGWVLFRSDSIGNAYQYIKALFGLVSFKPAFGIAYYVRPGGWCMAAIAALGAIGCGRFLDTSSHKLVRAFSDIFLYLVFISCLIFLTANNFSPFIYFNF